MIFNWWTIFSWEEVMRVGRKQVTPVEAKEQAA
jgi:hypothetical protein